MEKLRKPKGKKKRKFRRSLALVEMEKQKKAKSIQKSSKELKVAPDEHRYSDLIEDNPEIKKLYEKYLKDNINIKEELALFRAYFVNAVKNEDGFSIDKFLVCLDKLTQMTERAQKVDKGKNTEMEKAITQVVFTIDNMLAQCPYCNMSLAAIKETLAKELMEYGTAH